MNFIPSGGPFYLVYQDTSNVCTRRAARGPKNFHHTCTGTHAPVQFPPTSTGKSFSCPGKKLAHVTNPKHVCVKCSPFVPKNSQKRYPSYTRRHSSPPHKFKDWKKATVAILQQDLVGDLACCCLKFVVNCMLLGFTVGNLRASVGDCFSCTNRYFSSLVFSHILLSER